MRSYWLLLLVFLQFGCKDNAYYASGETEKEYQLVWEDEFDDPERPDPSKWGYEYGFIRNQEAQYYVDSLKNVRTGKGMLILEAHLEQIENRSYRAENPRSWKEKNELGNYTSASITTIGLAEFTYGKIEVRAKLPRGRGMWPAIWMLGENWKEIGWPDCGEIDIMEHVGFNKDSIFGTVHTKAFNHAIGTEVGKSVFIDNPYDDFHVYSIEWTPEKIDFILDGTPYHRFNNGHKTEDEWPFDQPFHLKLNVAVGGTWGGQKGIDDSIFPQQMVVDYVRIYQIK